MTLVSYAQNFEDVLLWRALGDVVNGFYIDVGASHPDTDSVTRLFYDRGWHGINVEPVAESHRRLTVARTRDVNLRVALGASAGTAAFHAVADINNGLSTLDPTAVERYGSLGMDVTSTPIEVDTLAAICAAHAPPDIHFLKIDVEGAERDVLLGADFARFRPWIVLAEATAPMVTTETHADWEPLLIEAGYRFAWFDGLNRYYVAQERCDALLRHFKTPPNVFDNFIRVADTELARRVYQAETRAEIAAGRLSEAELRMSIAEDRSEVAHLRWARASVDLARTRMLAEQRALADADARDADARLRIAETRQAVEVAERATQRAAVAEQALTEARAWLEAMRGSTSWRLTAPLRRMAGQRSSPGGQPSATPATDPSQGEAVQAAAPLHAVPPAAITPPDPIPVILAVHQFHSGTAMGDAITNAMLLMRRLLRGLGYDSRIFAEHLDPRLAGEIHAIDDLPGHGRFVLIVHHSMGYDAFDRILALPVRKVLLYHNITPPELLEDVPHTRRYAEIGRQQLGALRTAVDAALADSEYNALELLQAGFVHAAACSMLFDLDALFARVPPRATSHIFTVLFVGRVSAAKGQRDLVEAFAQFRSRYKGECRLVLVGRYDGGPYLSDLMALIRRQGLDTGAVEVAGLVSDAELLRRYGEADLYVSLSQHEGFGVPLIEAVAYGVPVLAVATGAVPYTLREPAGLLLDGSPARAAGAMLALANDRAARSTLHARQRTSIERFALRHQVPTLVEALVKAGAARPAGAAMHAALSANARFTVAGHINGTYSLAEVNRQVALALEAARPGSVRLLPVEGDVTEDVTQIPGDQPAIRRLLARSPPVSGPHIVISQHYPVWPPPERGDLALALFFWEESLVPAETVAMLGANFRGVLAPTQAVAKALIDSGIRIPVRVVGHSPRLAAYRGICPSPPVERDAPFTILHVSSCFPRKGVDVLLSAYARAFRLGDNVRLVIKGFPNAHNTVAADLARRQEADAALAPVEFINRDVGTTDMLALYRDADVMALPTRGEGYNLPAAEALSAGLPLIVTGFGGHMDFLSAAPPNGATPGAVRTIDYRVETSGSHLATPFSLWAEPDEDDLVQALRDASAAGRRPHQPIHLPPIDVAENIATFAADLLLALPPRPLTVGWITTWDVRCGIAEYSRHLVGAVDLPCMIFPDVRTRSDDQPGGPAVCPSWALAELDSYSSLMGAVLRADPRAVVLQHQPGLIPWAHLPTVLGHPALDDRVVCITLHNTQGLEDAPDLVRHAAVSALRRMSRVVVHTLHDMNALVRLGLGGVATLIPQGTEQARSNHPVRPLDPGSDVIIGCYGFFLPAKGIPQLVEALAILRRTWPYATLRLVNAEYPLPESPAEIEVARTVAERLGITDSVMFETRFLDRSASLDLLSGCDIIALPYQRSKEGSSAALRGAIAAGVPVAVTPLPLFDEAGGVTTALPGMTPDEIAAGLDGLLRDHEARTQAVGAGQAWSAARDWASIGRRWQGMLEALSASDSVMTPHE